jgi:glycosyltransferase involved in cell wall biosynthesis
MYLGRGSVISRLLQSLATSAARSDLDATFIVSARNTCLEGVVSARAIIKVPAIRSVAGCVMDFPRARHAIVSHIAERHAHAVINLMPHLWSPLLVGTIRRLGAKYFSVVHDASGHPGDSSGIVVPWLHREAKSADRVIALSSFVAAELVRRRVARPKQIASLFLPDILYGQSASARRYTPGSPLRLLFFGRLLKYKGLPHLIDAIEILKCQNVRVDLGVAGQGDIRRLRQRLQCLDAEVINRWIDEHEVGPLLNRYDVMALAHIECSQSGVAATAFGSGMPVVAMPVGGMTEQVLCGSTGVLAKSATPEALAEAIKSLVTDRNLYRQINHNLRATSQQRSAESFLARLLVEVVRCGPPSVPRSRRDLYAGAGFRELGSATP